MCGELGEWIRKRRGKGRDDEIKDNTEVEGETASIHSPLVKPNRRYFLHFATIGLV